MVETVIKTISVPAEQRKKTTLASNLYYDTLEIYDNRVVGHLNGQQTLTWFFQDFNGIDVVKASLNSQFAQVVFLTGLNSKNRTVGVDLMMSQNLNAMNDTNRILFCCGMFSFGKTNEFAETVASDIRAAYENYRNRPKEEKSAPSASAADEIKKFKELLDVGIISQDEFDTKKKQLLGI